MSAPVPPSDRRFRTPACVGDRQQFSAHTLHFFLVAFLGLVLMSAFFSLLSHALMIFLDVVSCFLLVFPFLFDDVI